MSLDNLLCVIWGLIVGLLIGLNYRGGSRGNGNSKSY